MNKLPSISELFLFREIVPVSDIPTSTLAVNVNELEKNSKEVVGLVVEIDGKERCGLLHSFINLSSVCNEYNGLGLSDVQLGGNWKLFVVKAKPDEDVFTRYEDGSGYRCFVNCEYEPLTEEKVEILEGCLSLPNRFFMVPRWKSVRVHGFEFIAKKLELRPFDQVMSSDTYDEIVFQHEIDHHNNILISDIGQEVSLKPI